MRVRDLSMAANARRAGRADPARYPCSDASSRARLSRACRSYVRANAASGKITGCAAKLLRTADLPAR